VRVLVYAPEDFNNVCVLARTLEVLGVDTCLVYDPNRLIRRRYGKSYSRRLRAVSAGAFFRIRFERVAEPVEFIKEYAGRSIATVPERSATSLHDFRFREDDLLVFGSEGRGLPGEVIEACDEHLTIPQRGATQSLNLSVASGIVLAEWFRQAEDPPSAVHPGAGCGIPKASKRYERRDVTYDD
jgi:tRNA (cytidine/uridine-2'-O-)-methyltransferase